MNERAAPPEAPSPQPSRRTPVVVTGRDREFLPAALEILGNLRLSAADRADGDDWAPARWRRWSGRISAG